MMDAKMNTSAQAAFSERVDSLPADLSQGSAHAENLLTEMNQMLSRVHNHAQQLQQELTSLSAQGAQTAKGQSLQEALQTLLQKTHDLTHSLSAQQAYLNDGSPASAQWLDTQAHMLHKTRKQAQSAWQDTLQSAGTRAATASGHMGWSGQVQTSEDDVLGVISDASGQTRDEQDRLVQLPAGEHEGLDGVVSMVGGMLRANATTTAVGKRRLAASDDVETLQNKWGQYVTQQYKKSPQNLDIEQLIQWVMREAYVGNNQDLRAYATRVEYYTQLKKQLRVELDRAREFRSAHSTGPGKDQKLTEAFDKKRLNTDPEIVDGQWRVRPFEDDKKTESVAELDAYIKSLDNLLSTVGDDSQIAHLELQNMTQKQAQLLNALSNLSKVLHDTAMSILRKIGS